VALNPWIGTAVRGAYVHNPWPGRVTRAGVATNPWTGRRNLNINTGRRWW
jgi:hypothetical protein